MKDLWHGVHASNIDVGRGVLQHPTLLLFHMYQGVYNRRCDLGMWDHRIFLRPQLMLTAAFNMELVCSRGGYLMINELLSDHVPVRACPYPFLLHGALPRVQCCLPSEQVVLHPFILHDALPHVQCCLLSEQFVLHPFQLHDALSRACQASSSCFVRFHCTCMTRSFVPSLSYTTTGLGHCV